MTIQFNQTLGTNIGWTRPDYVHRKLSERRNKAIREQKRELRSIAMKAQRRVEVNAQKAKRDKKDKSRRKAAKASRRKNRR